MTDFASRARITILGAGAMGSALSTPAADNGHDVRLWGTWLDDELLDAVEAHEPHPRTGIGLNPRVCTFRSAQLAEALADATHVVLAVSSDGIVDVLRAAAAHLQAGQILGITTKGFAADGARVTLLPDAVARVLRETSLVNGDGCPALPVVAIGGPCKANEVAARRPTAAVYAADTASTAAACRDVFVTAAYGAEISNDPRGVEIAAAMKNVYAIALGVCQGLGDRGDGPFHDLQAAVFARAVTEMTRLAVALGGRPETVTGLAGIGDLEVTGLSGRNRVYGTRIGSGEPPLAALKAMRDAGQTVEGVPAAYLARDLIDQLVPSTRWTDFPLLAAIVDLVGREAEAGADAETHDELADRLAGAVLPGAHKAT
jgi:glycerol-3-phosphate dehydrogenase (NAD(P)+)